MADSDFCLVPAGDNDVTSRLYSAIAAGCIPVVISPGLSGAFASTVPYDSFWLRVQHQAFVASPVALVPRLEAMPWAERERRRALMAQYAADVLYDVPGSRVASNFLRAAFYGCINRGVPLDTDALGIVTPDEHRLFASTLPTANETFGFHNGFACSCVRRPPQFWWTASPPAPITLLGGGQFEEAPAELCNCNVCRRFCDPQVRLRGVSAGRTQAPPRFAGRRGWSGWR